MTRTELAAATASGEGAEALAEKRRGEKSQGGGEGQGGTTGPNSKRSRRSTSRGGRAERAGGRAGRGPEAGPGGGALKGPPKEAEAKSGAFVAGGEARRDGEAKMADGELVFRAMGHSVVVLGPKACARRIRARRRPPCPRQTAHSASRASLKSPCRQTQHVAGGGRCRWRFALLELAVFGDAERNR